MTFALHRCGAALGALLAAGPATAAAATYRFDAVHTQIWFSVDHERFSRPQGRLRVADGWFQFDEDDWSASRVDVTIDLAGVDLGDEQWNRTVASAQFLDAERRPTARYVSRSVEKTGARAGVIHGDLYLHGAKQPVDVLFTLNRVGTDPYLFKRKAGFSASAHLARSAFGMKRYAEVVGDDVELRFEIEGLRDEHAAEPKEPPR